MNPASQLALRFPYRPSLSGENFLVAANNSDAVTWLDRWPDWPAPALAIWGPRGCGKTHLAEVFLARSGARRLEPSDLADADPRDLLRNVPACVLDDGPRFLGGDGEQRLLHLYNTVAETSRRMLLTAEQPPAHWSIGLADLRSRLNAAAVIGIGAPDDMLIRAVLVKQFADRQLAVDDDGLDYMLARMERTFDAARRLVAAIDDAALRAKRRVTVPLIRDVLAGEDIADAH